MSHEKKFFPLISAFLDSEVEDDTRSELEEHLKSCSGCREALDDFQAMRRFASGAESFPINPFFMTRLRAKLKEVKSRVQDSTAVEAKLFVPLFITLVVTIVFLFSLSAGESNEASDDYLYFEGRRTSLEQQLLFRHEPISNDEVLLLSVSTSQREEPNGR